MRIIQFFVFALIILINHKSYSIESAVKREHHYAVVFSQSFPKAKNIKILDEIKASPLAFSEHTRLYAAYYYADLLTGTPATTQQDCSISLNLLNQKMSPTFEPAAHLVRFFCYKKTNNSKKMKHEIEKALGYNEINFAVHLFFNDAMRALKDIGRIRPQDFLTFTAVYAGLPTLNYPAIAKTIIEFEDLSTNDKLKIGLLMEKGAKRDFSESNESTWLPRASGLFIQKQVLEKCPNTVPNCENKKIIVKNKLDIIKKEQLEASKVARDESDDLMHIMENEMGADLEKAQLWFSDPKNAKRFSEAVSKVSKWNKYLSFH